MNTGHSITPGMGLSLRQAALVAGFGLLAMALAAPFAEFFVYAELVVREDIAATVANLAQRKGLFVAGMFAYFLVFVLDIVVAWALYVLLRPVNPALSLFTAWLRLVYTTVALVATFKLFGVFRLLHTPETLNLVGQQALYEQVYFLLNAFRVEWGISLVLFGVYLGFLGWLVYRSGYIPRLFGVLLIIAGLGYLITYSGPYLYPDWDTGFLFITFFGELLFMLWLLIRGWKLEQPPATA